MVLEIILVSLRIVELVIKDMPAERRAEAWERWFKFCDRVEALGKQ
jgi:hypothetical protein